MATFKNVDKDLLLELVKEEVTKLKEHATVEELSRLHLGLMKNTATRCIYGSLTGNCYSKRAVELIVACCDRVYTSNGELMDENTELNGSPVGKKREAYHEYCPTICEYYSPIEILLSIECDPYCYLKEDTNTGRSVKFLKGEIDVLNLHW